MAIFHSVYIFAAILSCAMAARPWLGTWHAWTTKAPENLEAFFGALGLPTPDYSPGQVLGNLPILKIVQDGQQFTISFEVPNKNFKHTHAFTLGQEVSHSDPKFLDNALLKYTYTEDGDKLKATINVPSKNKIIHDTYEVVPGQRGPELVKTFEVDGIKGKQYFRDISNDFKFDFTK